MPRPTCRRSSSRLRSVDPRTLAGSRTTLNLSLYDKVSSTKQGFVSRFLRVLPQRHVPQPVRPRTLRRP